MFGVVRSIKVLYYYKKHWKKEEVEEVLGIEELKVRVVKCGIKFKDNGKNV